MDENNIAIKITGLKKRYRLGVITAGTLQGDIQSWWARIRGKEDPNLKIGQKRGNKNEIFYALDGIDLTIKKGERVGIIGHNGAGKSTLLKLLSRVTGPTEGQICIDGRISSMLEVGTGFNGELTGRENTYLNGAILGMSKKEVDAKMNSIIEFSEVGQFIDTPVKRYSSGMFVKLAFSVAAHLDNEIMIMDEVLAVGDMAFQSKCLNKMSEVSQEEGRTVLYVSHNMNTIRRLCNRCIVLDHGKVVFDGDVEPAIDIYMKNNQDENGVYAYHRVDDVPERYRAIVQSAELIDNDRGVYGVGDVVNFKIKYLSSAEVKDVSFRFIVHNRYAEPVGISFIDKFDLKDGESERSYQFNLDRLAPGTYYVKFVLSQDDGVGNTDRFDIVEKLLCFEVREGLGEFANFVWGGKSWGYFNFPNIIEVK